MFNVTMQRRCFFCQAPTKILLDFPDDDITDKAFAAWRKLFKRDFSYNVRYFKKVGSVVRNVCTYCYIVDHKFDLKGREITGKRICVKSEALSTRDIWNWLDMFNDFRNRKDIKELLHSYSTDVCI
jgi:hypothetical protein